MPCAIAWGCAVSHAGRQPDLTLTNCCGCAGHQIVSKCMVTNKAHFCVRCNTRTSDATCASLAQQNCKLPAANARGKTIQRCVEWWLPLNASKGGGCIGAREGVHCTHLAALVPHHSCLTTRASQCRRAHLLSATAGGLADARLRGSALAVECSAARGWQVRRGAAAQGAAATVAQREAGVLGILLGIWGDRQLANHALAELAAAARAAQHALRLLAGVLRRCHGHQGRQHSQDCEALAEHGA